MRPASSVAGGPTWAQLTLPTRRYSHSPRFLALPPPLREHLHLQRFLVIFKLIEVKLLSPLGIGLNAKVLEGSKDTNSLDAYSNVETHTQTHTPRRCQV